MVGKEKIKEIKGEILTELIVFLGEAYPEQLAKPELMLKFASSIEGILKKKLGEVF